MTEEELRLQQNFQAAIKSGKRIEAIKLYRLMNNCGFREAVDYVENNWLRLRRDCE